MKGYTKSYKLNCININMDRFLPALAAAAAGEAAVEMAVAAEAAAAATAAASAFSFSAAILDGSSHQGC